MKMAPAFAARMATSAWVLLCLFVVANSGHAQSSRPNILVIFSDDHTQQTISAYGSKLATTPSIDRLAKEGAIFNNTFVTNSICAPARAVLLTGKYGHLSGLIDNSPNRTFNGAQQQVQKLLKAAAYQTAWIGKWHLQTLPQGFDYWTVLPDQGHYYNPDFINMRNDTVRHAGYVSDVISDFSIDWLNQRDTNKPFFLVIGEKATHREWLPDIQDLGSYDSVNFPMPSNFYDDYINRRAAAEQDMTIDKTMRLEHDLKVNIDYEKNYIYKRLTPQQRKPFKAYYDKVSAEYEQVKDDPKKLLQWKYQRYLKDYLATARSLDRNIGRILHYLDSTGLASNTLVVYASDQGFYMGEHGWFDKRFMYEESLRTPFLMRFPGVIKPGTAINEMVVNIDFAPTLLQAAGLPVPADMQGRSVLPLCNPKAFASKDMTPWRREMYYHYYEYPEPHRVPPHIGIRTSRYKLIRFYKAFDAWELYDLQQDQLETRNLYGKPGYDQITAQLKVQLLQQARYYGDTEAVQLLERLEN